MRPQSCKAKGRRGQQEVRDALLAAFPQLQPDDIRSTSMGASGEDLLLSPSARVLIPYSPEIKKVEAINIWAAIEQASGRKHPGIVIFGRNKTPFHVAIPLVEFIKLLKDAAYGVASRQDYERQRDYNQP